MTLAGAFGDSISDLPVDKEKRPSQNKELLVSIFAPKQEIEGYSNELKSLGVAVIMFAILSTEGATNFLRQYNKNPHILRLAISVVTSFGFYYYTTTSNDD